MGLTKWAVRDIYDNCILLPKWQSKLLRRAAYDRKRMACETWAGWFKWQVIEQQTRIKTVLMSSVFHLGSIRRLVEAEANTCSRERLQRRKRWETIELLHHREDAGICLSNRGPWWKLLQHRGWSTAVGFYPVRCQNIMVLMLHYVGISLAKQFVLINWKQSWQ